MEKMKIGVVGVGRGEHMINYSRHADNAQLVAVCDKWKDGLDAMKSRIGDDRVSYYTDYDEFLKHDMDIVILANYATEHAPFAIRAMEAGKHVISEVLPVQTMAQAVALIECIERTGKRYCYAENYCFMNAPVEMRRKYLAGELGEFEYGEGEYLHNCEPIWSDITYGDKAHWRNTMTAFYYCTHSACPLLHITGLRPVSVVGFEGPFNARMARMGAKAGAYALEIATLENGAIIKSVHGVGPSKNSVWYSVYGTKGRMESAREDAEQGGNTRVYSFLDEEDGGAEKPLETYIPENKITGSGVASGHGGSDFFTLHNAIEHIAGREGDFIDVHEALNAWMIGFFAYVSVLSGGTPQRIPDLTRKEERDRFRNDNRCTDPAVAGNDLLPSYSKGNPDIPDAVYEGHRKTWLDKHNVTEEQAKAGGR